MVSYFSLFLEVFFIFQATKRHSGGVPFRCLARRLRLLTLVLFFCLSPDALSPNVPYWTRTFRPPPSSRGSFHCPLPVVTSTSRPSAPLDSLASFHLPSLPPNGETRLLSESNRTTLNDSSEYSPPTTRIFLESQGQDPTFSIIPVSFLKERPVFQRGFRRRVSLPVKLLV